MLLFLLTTRIAAMTLTLLHTKTLLTLGLASFLGASFLCYLAGYSRSPKAQVTILLIYVCGLLAYLYYA